jgi:hypothetical protein
MYELSFLLKNGIYVTIHDAAMLIPLYWSSAD